MDIYLDNASTTPVFEEVIKQLPVWTRNFYANPNSIHKLGQKVKNEIEKVRQNIANIINESTENIIFTSGATESNNTIIKGYIEKTKKREILISSIEHKSVLNVAKYLAKKGIKIKFLKVDENGKIDLDYLKKSLSKETALACIIHTNNETGVKQDIKEISKILKEHEIPLFSDTVQSFIKEEIDFQDIDFYSVSGHKINSIKGIGLLVKKKDLSPLIHGGGQENGFRSGTQNVIGILAIGKAIEIWDKNKEEYKKNLKQLKETFETRIKEEIPDIKIVSEKVERANSISCLIFPKVDAQSLVISLGRQGVYLSSGSACSSGTPTPSHVLLAYGYSEEEALKAIRVSFGVFNSLEEVEESVLKIKKSFEKIYKFSF